MKESDPAKKSPPTADEVQRVYPDLAKIFIHAGSSRGEHRGCSIHLVEASLLAIGHSKDAIEVVIDAVCPCSEVDKDELLVKEEDLAIWNSLAIALSGGGLRATLFELGILLYLAIAKELQNVTAIVSVSGGSILAAHVATRWKEATASPDGFITVAADLIQFARSDIRNSAMIRWIWTRPLIFTWFTWLWPSWGTTSFLQQQYRKHFGEQTLGQLSSGNRTPQFAFIATDVKKHHRVAFSSDGIFRLSFAGKLIGDPILASGVRLSLAVTASSCFPPVFKNLLLTHQELGLKYNEFDERLNLSDGGVSGNLGVEVLNDLLHRNTISAMRILVCDAECGLATEPSTNILAVSKAQGTALSESARQLVQKLGSNAQLLQFANRVPDTFGLPFLILTKLSSFRTDLDQPTWQECYALMVHGAAVCEHALGSKVAEPPNPDQIRGAIQKVLHSAGGPEQLPELDEAALSSCGRRCYWKLGIHFLLAVLVFIIVLASICEVVTRFYPDFQTTPLHSAFRAFVPEPIYDRNINNIAEELGKAICNDSVPKLRERLMDGTLSRVAITVGANPSNLQLYFHQTVQPPNCDHSVACEFVFRGDFEGMQFQFGHEVVVTGRIVRIWTTKEGTNAYVDFQECSAKPKP